MRILIVEDHISIQEVIRRLLEPYVGGVEVAPTLAQGIDVISRKQTDVAIIDLALPDSDYAETLKTVGTIRKIDPDCVLIAMSGVVPVEKLEQEAKAAGFDDWLHKYEVAERPRKAIIGTIARSANRRIFDESKLQRLVSGL